MTDPARFAMDRQFMLNALSAARRGLGAVWPNPAVGCVIVRPDDAGRPEVVGRGWTQPGGRPHAETEALRRAGGKARGATAYVTLEPCSHQGMTPPCVDALLQAGIGRVVVAMTDPDPRVSGRGIDRLRNAGISVVTDVCRDEAFDVNRGYFLRNTAQRPLFSLKVATTLDARIATAQGDSQWITGPGAHKFAHLLRAEHDAILIGSGTVRSDDPSLTCRLIGLQHRSPIRIVVDSRLSISEECTLIRGARDTATWVYTCADAEPARVTRLTESGVLVVTVDSDRDGRVDLSAMARDMGDRGLTRVLVEGGGEIAAGLLKASLIDRLYAIRHPSVMGGDGVAAIAAMDIASLSDTIPFTYRTSWFMAADIVEVFDRRDVPKDRG